MRDPLTRRAFLATSAVLSTLPVAADEPPAAVKKLKVVVFGGHPDDPESGAGGLVAALTRQG
ncbi:PIG-L deacetylase family protein, partial [Singulisphaera rosea]